MDKDKKNYMVNGLKLIIQTLAGLCAIYFLILAFRLPMTDNCLMPIGKGGWEIPVYVIGFCSFIYGVYLTGKNAVQKELKKKP